MQSNENKGGIGLFFRNLGECASRAVIPFMMYLFMGILLLASQMIPNKPLMYIVSVICLLGGCAYNVLLCFTTGKQHIDALLIGNVHRENALLGIPSGANHRVEREYRAWKGFVIGFIVGIPVIILGLIAGANPASTAGGGAMIIMMFLAGWAIIPVAWIRAAVPTFSFYFSLLFIVIPVLVSGISYILGARKQRRVKEEEKARMERVRELAREQQAKRK